jgi:hypothetical protein
MRRSPSAVAIGVVEARLMRTRRRMRWGVQGMWTGRGWQTLGIGWYSRGASLPACVDYWPMNFATRREALTESQALRVGAKRLHMPWKFRVVRLRIEVHKCS